MISLSIQEIWDIKKNLSGKFWGKSADEINIMIKPDVEKMKLKIEQLRRKSNLSKTAEKY
jgi:hypothetical protein